MSDPGDTATRDEEKYEEKRACKDQFSERGGNTGQAGKETAHKQQIIGSILHEGPVVKGGIKKKKTVDIKQCETRSSKQRLKGKTERRRKNYRYKE